MAFFSFFPGKGEFDPSKLWWSGYLPKFIFDAAGVHTVEITPYPCRITPLAGAARQWFLDYIDRISSLLLTDCDRLHDIGCSAQYLPPLKWLKTAPVSKLIADIEDEEAIRALSKLRHLWTCRAHNVLMRNVVLLIEQKRMKELQQQLPELTELRTDRFMEQE